jgi:hypothetical protein
VGQVHLSIADHYNHSDFLPLGMIAGDWLELNNRVDEIRGTGNVRRSDDELFVTAAAMEHGNNWENIREILCRIDKLMSYYEMKEAATILI